MRVITASLGLTLIFGHATLCMADSTRTTLDVWPGKAPGEVGTVAAEQAKTETRPDGTTVITSLTNVSKPTLAVFRPEATKNTGVAVAVFPGGAYTFLAWDHEGEQVARWLNSIGVTAAVLKYRVPRREGSKGRPPVQASMDAQRAVSLVRSKAAEWGIDAKRIGVLGFSAGGHLAAWAATNFDQRAYEKIDATDDVSCRPDFAVLIYPAGIVKREPAELSPEIRVTPQTPPCFFAHADDDQNSPVNSVAMYLALRRAKVPAELHVYVSGGHGFGMRATGKPTATWPKRCEEWLRDMGILKVGSGPTPDIAHDLEGIATVKNLGRGVAEMAPRLYANSPGNAVRPR
jgi:acetyl esterase/lipase